MGNITKNNTLYSYPNKWSRVFLQSIEEIIGYKSLKAVLDQADLKHLIPNTPQNDFVQSMPFSEISRILVSLEQLYGPRGGNGLAFRAGRVFFKTGLKEFGEELRITDTDFRLLPLDKKINVGLEALARLFNQQTDQLVKIEVFPNQTLWITNRCPFCWNRSADSHVCYIEVGMLQEALCWISGGKYFHIEEIECIAMGDSSCTIAIAKTSLD
jgi:predicted hydrocarbon binding protein